MAELDLSDAFGPEFLDLFCVTERREEVDSNGESVVTNIRVPDVAGVITAASPDDLERLPEADRMGRTISVVTQYRLRGPSETRHDSNGVEYKPSLIEWQGNTFVVKQVDPYTHFGSGFIQAIAGSIESIDLPPPSE